MRPLRTWLRRLSIRLALISAAIIIGALAVFTFLVAEKQTATLSLELRKQAIALADNLAASSASYLVVEDYTTLESMLIRAAKFPSINELQVFDQKGAMLGDVFRTPKGELETRYDSNVQIPTGKPVQSIDVQVNSMTVWQPVMLGDLVGWVRINYTLDRIVESRQQAMTYTIVVGTIVGIISISLLLLYLRKPVVLIEQSAEFADELDQHAGHQITENQSYYEIHKLISALNRTSRSLQEKNEALNRKILGQEQLNERLEQMVQERTEELLVARDEAIKANQSKSEFLANMSHEIRTPLTAIIGFSDSILDSDQSMEDRIDSAKRVTRAGKHLLRVINEILDLSKVEANKLEVEILPVNLPEIFRDVYSFVKLSAEEKGLSVEFDCDYPLPEIIHTDPVRFKQILINLCNNAIKFTRQGGVTIKVACDVENESLFIKIIDTGVGLSSSQISRLFKPFSQADMSIARNYGGTGLGLYLSKQLAEKLGGDLTVESLLDVGSSFNLIIKTGKLANVQWMYERPDIERVDDKIDLIQDLPVLSGRVLLTEDNQDNQRLISLYLRRLGVEFDIANNGKEAILKVNKYFPDLIIMDVQMPVMDGLTATKKLRRQGCQTPVIALTANAMQHEQQQCLDAGCNDVCTKPIDCVDFVRVLSRYLEVSTKNKDTSPIVSARLRDDPEMREIVLQFASRLPDMISEIIASFADDDFEKMKMQLHTLKGAGGNCGFDNILEMVNRIEFDLLAGNHAAIVQSLEALLNIVNRIAAGIDEQNHTATTNIRPFKNPV